MSLTLRAKVFTVTASLVLAAGISDAVTIGPDAGGYTATDTEPFGFFDISSTGTRVLAGLDDSTVSAPLGFTFTFYGSNYTSICMSTNGLLTFAGCNTAFSNETFHGAPAISPDLPTIAVLWDDWQFFQTGADAVYYQTQGVPGSRQFIVQWNNAFGYASSPLGVKFQAILNEGSNTIKLQYLSTATADFRGLGASATVGIRDFSGTGRALLWSYNSARLEPGDTVQFNPYTHVVPGLYGHHPNHGHHGTHGHTQPDTPFPPHIPGHTAGVSLGEASPPLEPALVSGLSAARRGSIVELFATASGILLRDEAGLDLNDDPTLFAAPVVGRLYRTRELPVVTIGGAQAEVLFSGMAPGLTGVWQINVRVPEAMPANSQAIVVVSYGERTRLKTVVAVE